MATVQGSLAAVKWVEELQRATTGMPVRTRVAPAVVAEAARIAANLARLHVPLPVCRPSGSSDKCLQQIARKRLGMGWTSRAEVLQ